MPKDPVCGMQVDEEDAIVSMKGEKTQYFCSEECKEKFEEDPERYQRKSA
jgi:Cu+-exporting ATPase